MPVFQNVDWLQIAGVGAYWIGYGLVAALILVVFFVALHFTTFNFRMSYIELYGSGKKGNFGFGKKQNNRIKWIKNKTKWRALYPLFNREDLEPFNSEYIYPGNHLEAIKYNNTYIPLRINIEVTENERFTKEGKERKPQEWLSGILSPVPHYIRNWQSLTHKKNAQEFAEHSFWEDNKQFLIALITIGFCCTLTAFTFWLAYKFATEGGSLNTIVEHTQALTNFGVIPGK